MSQHHRSPHNPARQPARFHQPSRFSSAFPFAFVLCLFDSQHREELVGSDVVEGKRNAEPEGSTKINRPAEELSRLGMLRGV